jgi:DNA-binding XRE family transcriptional regulator
VKAVVNDVQDAPETGDRHEQFALFGARVRELRLAAGMRQSDLAEKAGLARIAISNIERGLRDGRRESYGDRTRPRRPSR